MVTFFHILTEIVGEKESRLRLGMRMMGLKTSVYWLVWFFTGAFYILLATLVLIGAGLACQFAFFTNSNVGPDAINSLSRKLNAYICSSLQCSCCSSCLALPWCALRSGSAR